MSFALSIQSFRKTLTSSNDEPIFSLLEGLFQITLRNTGGVAITLVEVPNTPASGYVLLPNRDLQFEIYGDGSSSLYGKVSGTTTLDVIATRLTHKC